MAEYLGDPTARLAGRLTLNPLPHIDLLGSILIPAMLFFSGVPILFGWAKPVPYNPYNLSNQRYGNALVAGAGVGTNLIIAIIFGLMIRFTSLPTAIIDIFIIIVRINLVLGIFNLVPIPPLDGSKILFDFMPNSEVRNFLEQYGFIILIFFIFYGFGYLQPIISGLFQAITGISI